MLLWIAGVSRRRRCPLKLSAAAVFTALVTVSLSGCGEPPKSGLVTSTEFNRAHADPFLYCAAWITTRIGSVSSTTCAYWATGYTHEPDRWRLKLRDQKHTGWREVSHAEYDRCPLDSDYPNCAG